MANGIYTEIKKRIIATITTIRKCLGRQVEENAIRRIIDGVYEKPVYSNLLKEYVPANPEKVAYAIARGFHWTIAPCGDVALNKLGLSMQVPVVWSYISDGPYRKFSWDNVTISFKHRTNRQISFMSESTILVVEATGVSEWIYEVIRKVRFELVFRFLNQLKTTPKFED